MASAGPALVGRRRVREYASVVPDVGANGAFAALNLVGASLLRQRVPVSLMYMLSRYHDNAAHLLSTRWLTAVRGVGAS